MNRRQSLKALGLTTVSSTLLLDACHNTEESVPEAPAKPSVPAGRQAYEAVRDKELESETFFTAREMATLTLLADMIIPRDDHSGSASQAGVPAFFEFIVKDIPDYQTPLRGGLRWLDMHCATAYGKAFADCSEGDRTDVVTSIAYPAKAAPGVQQGVAFFSQLRDLTATGFYTSAMGMKDLGYAGNAPGIWKGVPDDVLKKYGLEGI